MILGDARGRQGGRVPDDPRRARMLISTIDEIPGHGVAPVHGVVTEPVT
jgi:hypothetical protein